MSTLFTQAFAYYRRSFQGFSREVWWLALATLINRAGAMVLPFLSLYLTNSLAFTLEQVGWIMTFFGLGSFIGAWLGGELTNRYGAYRTMIFSLVASGLALFVFGTFQDFWWICFGIFTVSLISDTFRPAVFVSLAAYAKPENRTRAVTLVRLAINLGFSLGPAIGGLIIVWLGYSSLFWIDGLTCILAGVVILITLVEKKTTAEPTEKERAPKMSHVQILKDYRFMIFLGSFFLFALIFVQYFSAMPVYYKTIRFLTEDEVGWLLSINGLMIFFAEMPLIYALDKPSYSKFNLMAISSVILTLSFLVLFYTEGKFILAVGMALATLAEMLCFPFTNAYAMQKGGAGNEGRYMAYYTMSFSLAHIVGHNLGMQVSNVLGFNGLFVMLIVMALASGILFWWMGRLNPRPVSS